MKFKRQNIFLTIVLIILISITLGISYAFLQTSFFANKESILKVGSLSLVLDESKGNAITVSADGPLSDDEGVNLDNYYAFKLTNNGKVASQYTIYLDDQPLDDGDVRINQKYIHYSLEKDESNNIAKSLTGNQKLESGIINSKQTINYKLRLWFSSDMTIEEENKVFKAKLRIEGISTSEESLNKKCQDAGGDLFIDGECRKYYVMKNNLVNMEKVSFGNETDGDKINHIYDSSTRTWSINYTGNNKWFGLHITPTPESVKHLYYGYYESNCPTFNEGAIEFFTYNNKPIYSTLSLSKFKNNIYSYYYRLSDDIDINKITNYRSYFQYNQFPKTTELSPTYTLNNYKVIDLTLMFGEGNEPSREWCDKNLSDYIEYNETGIKTPISDINYTGKTSYYDVISISK